MSVAWVVGGSTVLNIIAGKAASDAQIGASRDASKATKDAADKNIAFQKEVFETQRKDLEPWRESGVQALDYINKGMASGEFMPEDFNFKFSQDDPSYRFRQEEGINALDASASSRGRLRSGAQDRAVSRYASNLASTEYGNAFNRYTSKYNADVGKKTNAFNRYLSLSEGGRGATNTGVAASQNMARQVGSSINTIGTAGANEALNVGNARASGYQNMAGAINQAGSNIITHNALNRPLPVTPATPVAQPAANPYRSPYAQPYRGQV